MTSTTCKILPTRRMQLPEELANYIMGIMHVGALSYCCRAGLMGMAKGSWRLTLHDSSSSAHNGLRTHKIGDDTNGLLLRDALQKLPDASMQA